MGREFEIVVKEGRKILHRSKWPHVSWEQNREIDRVRYLDGTSEVFPSHRIGALTFSLKAER